MGSGELPDKPERPFLSKQIFSVSLRTLKNTLRIQDRRKTAMNCILFDKTCVSYPTGRALLMGLRAEPPPD
jgi:hypothetical protein